VGRTFARDSFFVLVTKVVMMLAGLISAAIISRTLGKPGTALYATAFATINIIMSFTNFGVNRTLTVLYASKRYDNRTFFANILSMHLVSSLAAMAVVAAVYATGPAAQYGWNLLLPAVLCVPFLLWIDYGNGIFLAQEHIKGYNRSLLQRHLGFLGGLTTFLLLGFRDLSVTLGFLVGAISGASSPLLRFRKELWVKPEFDRIFQIDLLKMGMQYAFTMFVLSLSYRLGILILGALGTQEMVALFSNGISVVETLWQIPTSLGIVLLSKSAVSATEVEAVRRSCKVLRSVLPIVFLAAALMWLIAPVLVPLLFGEEFRGSVDATRLLLPGVIMGVIYKVLGADLAGRGLPLFAAWAYLLSVTVNVIANFALIPRYGYHGAAVASSISYTVGAIAFFLMYIRRHHVRWQDALIPRRSDYALLIKRLRREKVPA